LTAQVHYERRLAAIMAIDMVGYSRQMEHDEAGTLNRFSLLRADVLEPHVVNHRGRVVKYTGDGCLLEFASAGAAADCALKIQGELSERNAALPPSEQIRLRIGINLGDIIHDRDEIYGDGVNVAVWLESIGSPDGIMISAAVQEQIAGRKPYRLVDLGYRRSEKTDRAVKVFRLCLPGEDVGHGRGSGDFPATADRPHLSILALPFRNLGCSPEDEYFAEGLTEDVITDLSRIPGSFVIARNTAFAYKGKAVDVTAIGRELSVRYVLEGSVRRAARKVRVNAKLIDTVTEAHVWAGRFDSDERDLLDLQDELTGRIAASLDFHLTDAESRRTLPERPGNLHAADLVMRGWSIVNRPTTRENLVAARRCFEAALGLEPDYAHALVGLAETHAYEVGNRWSVEPELQLRCAEATVLQALVLEAHYARGHHVRGILLRLMMQFEQALIAFERALALNRNLAATHAQIGFVKLLMGRPEETFADIEKAIRLSPRDFNLGAWLFMMGWAHLCLAQDARGIDVLHKATSENPLLPHSYALLAAGYALGGRVDQARVALAEYNRLMPDMTVKRATQGLSDRPAFISATARIRDGLILAGMPRE